MICCSQERECITECNSNNYDNNNNNNNNNCHQHQDMAFLLISLSHGSSECYIHAEPSYHSQSCINELSSFAPVNSNQRLLKEFFCFRISH